MLGGIARSGWLERPFVFLALPLAPTQPHATPPPQHGTASFNPRVRRRDELVYALLQSILHDDDDFVVQLVSVEMEVLV